MSKDLLISVINSCEERGIKIRGCVCDMGNHLLSKQLGFLDLNHKFDNPFDNTRSVYIFPDVPHLLKLLRNHLIDKVLKVNLYDYDDED